MISTSGVTLSYGQRVLFKDVNVKFVPGNCYGLIGANGAGKSTFLKILSGEIEPDFGDVAVQPGLRVGVLRQNQFEFDDVEVLRTVIMGRSCSCARRRIGVDPSGSRQRGSNGTRDGRNKGLRQSSAVSSRNFP